MLPDSNPSKAQVNVRVMYASRGDTPSTAEREFFESLTRIIREQWKDLKILPNADLIIHERPASLHNPRAHAVSQTLHELDVSQETAETESPIFHQSHDYSTHLRSKWLPDRISNTYIDDIEPESAKPKREKKTQAEGESKVRKKSTTPSKAITQEIPLVFVSNPENNDQLDSIREAQKTFAERLSAKGGTAYFTLTGTPSNENLSFTSRTDLNIAPYKNDLGRMEFEPLNHGMFQRIPRLKDSSTDLVSTYIRNLLLNTAQHLQKASRHIDILPPATDINTLFKPIEGYPILKFIPGEEQPAAIKPKQTDAATPIRDVTPQALAKPVPTIKTYITDERFDLIRSQISSGELSPMQAYNLHLPEHIHLGINQERRLNTLTEFLPNEDDLNRLKKLVNNEPFYDGKALPRALALALAYDPNEPKLGKLLEDPTTLNRIFTNISITPGQTTIHAFQEDYASFSKLIADKAISPLVAVNIIANYNKSVAQVKELKLDQPTAEDLASVLSGSFTRKLSLENKAQILGLAMTRLQKTGKLSKDHPDKTLRDLITSLQIIETQASTATAASNGAHPTSDLRRIFTSVVAAVSSAPVTEFSTPNTNIKAGRVVDTTAERPVVQLPEPRKAVVQIDSNRWNPGANDVQSIRKIIDEQRKTRVVELEDLVDICQKLAGDQYKITLSNVVSYDRIYRFALGPKIAPRKATSPKAGNDTPPDLKQQESPLLKIRDALSKFRKPEERLLLKDLFFAHLQVNRKFLSREELVEFRHQHHIEVADVPAKVRTKEHSEEGTPDAEDDAGAAIGNKAQAAKDEKARLETERKTIEALYTLSPEEEKQKLTHLKQYTEQWRSKHQSLNIKDLTVLYIALTDRVPGEDKIRDIAKEYGISIDDNDNKHSEIYLAIAKDGLNKVLATDLKTPEAPVAPRPATPAPAAQPPKPQPTAPQVATPAPTQPAPPKTTLPTRTASSASHFAANPVPAKPVTPQIIRPAPAKPIVPKPTASKPIMSPTITTEPREKGHHVRTAIMSPAQYEELKTNVTTFLADHNQRINKDELNILIEKIIGRQVSEESLYRVIHKINLTRDKVAPRARTTSTQNTSKSETSKPKAHAPESSPVRKKQTTDITETPFNQYPKGSFDLKEAIYTDCGISTEGYTFTPVPNVTQFALRLVKNELTDEDKEQLKSLNTLRAILNEICLSLPKSTLGLLVHDPEKYHRLIARIRSLGHSETTLASTEADPKATEAPVITIGDLRAKMTSALLMQSGPVTNKLLDTLESIIKGFRPVADTPDAETPSPTVITEEPSVTPVSPEPPATTVATQKPVAEKEVTPMTPVKPQPLATTVTTPQPTVAKKTGRKSYIADHEKKLMERALSLKGARRGISLHELNDLVYQLTGKHYESFKLSMHAERLNIPIVYDHKKTQTGYNFRDEELACIRAEANPLHRQSKLTRHILNNIVYRYAGVSLLPYELEHFAKEYKLGLRKDQAIDPTQTEAFAEFDVGNIDKSLLKQYLFLDFKLNNSKAEKFTSFEDKEILALLQAPTDLEVDDKNTAFSDLIDKLVNGNEDTLKSLLYYIVSADKDSEIGQLIRKPQVYEDLIQKISNIQKLTEDTVSSKDYAAAVHSDTRFARGVVAMQNSTQKKP